MYVRVYAPNGEPFDVPRERADRLILQEGWTQAPPQSTPAKKKRRKTERFDLFPTKDFQS